MFDCLTPLLNTWQTASPTVPEFNLSPDEGPAVFELGHDGLNPVLEPRRGLGPPLGILGSDGRPVGDLDLHLAVGEVVVGRDPVAGRPALRVKDGLHEQHVRDGVANGLRMIDNMN